LTQAKKLLQAKFKVFATSLKLLCGQGAARPAEA